MSSRAMSLKTLVFLLTQTSHALRQVAIVTGGTRGIGRGISEAFAASGYDLLISYNSNIDAADAAASELRMYGGVVEMVGGDLTLPSTRDAIFDTFDQSFGSKSSTELTAVVHNAGQYVGVTSTNAEGLSSSLEGFGDNSILASETGGVTLKQMKYYQALYGDAYIDVCERGIARMKKKYGGSLIGISSPGCTLQYNANLGYDMPGSGKCVMEYAMRLFALRCASRNINCNVVIPGVTQTEAWGHLAHQRGISSEDFLFDITQRLSPMNRTVEPREIGDIVTFLCSDQGRLITGISLPYDGGVHLRA